MDNTEKNVLGLKHEQLTPKVNNLLFPNEIDIFPGDIFNEKVQSIKSTLKPTEEYELFLKQKGRRPFYDIYACFQPFNEATKALYPFLKELQSVVKKGDTILNLWDRTGWLTNLLAGLFPEQTILTTWEGNKDVLGYNGYNFWTKNKDNIKVMFCDINKPLPLVNNSIAFSIGMDVLHRFDQFTLLNELDRVVVDSGAILFPHVHLSNSEPSPFFERGGKQMHGLEYQQAFDHLFKDSNRAGFVFSEPKLFELNDIIKSNYIKIKSTPNTNDYNGLLAILPENWTNKELTFYSMKDNPDLENSRVIVNLLLKIDLNHQLITIDREYLESTVGHLLDRHPVYEERIKNLNNYKLSELESKIIYLAQLSLSVKEISNRLNTDTTEVICQLFKLENDGLLQVLPISSDAVRLQNCIMTQKYIVDEKQQNIQCLWDTAVKLFPENIALISEQDESEFSYEDCNEVVNSIIGALQNNGLKPGDKIIISNKQHIEAVLLFWACMKMGIIVVPISDQLPSDVVKHIIKISEAKYCFTNKEFNKINKASLEALNVVCFDSEEEDGPEEIEFSEWIENNEAEVQPLPDLDHACEAVILFTSGSTGTPKGVQLSHGNLFRSGAQITESFHWTKSDRYFALGGLESMSGLRNSAIAALHCGASVYLPRENTSNNLFSITESIELSEATLMGSNPTLLRQLTIFKEKVGNQLKNIRTLICTGNKLSTDLRVSFQELYNIPIYNYYGLSETTGICITQDVNNIDTSTDNIGEPINCIAQIVDENDQLVPIGNQGELRIFSDNLMQGYLNNNQKTNLVIRNGWFYTEDLARYTHNSNIQLLGRKRNIVKTATETLVYLDEIQEYLQNSEFVEDNSVCAYEENDSEKIAAFVCLKEQHISNKEFIKKDIRSAIIKDLGKDKVPNQILMIDKLPYSDNGKLLKNELLNELQ